MFVLDDLLLAPVKGLLFIARRVKEAVDQELMDPQVIKRELLQLQMQRELGEISQEEAKRREAELFARQRAVREAQTGLSDSVHTADSTSIEVEAEGGDADGPGHWGERGRP